MLETSSATIPSDSSPRPAEILIFNGLLRRVTLFASDGLIQIGGSMAPRHSILVLLIRRKGSLGLLKSFNNFKKVTTWILVRACASGNYLILLQRMEAIILFHSSFSLRHPSHLKRSI